MTKLCLAAASLLYLALVVLALRPAFDLELAGLFYRGDGHFAADVPWLRVVRYASWAFPYVLFVAMAAAAGLRRLGLVPWGPRGRSLAFLALTLALGPGLAVHATLKEVSHRPRPYNLMQFGAHDLFRPWYRFDGACRHNCSFPSGEEAAAAWLFAPASLAPAPWRGAALAAVVVYALAEGLLRMAFGAHFLSDVCGAAFLTIMIVVAVRAWARRRA